MPCEFAYTCEFSRQDCREPRETPLLVDVLATALKDIIVRACYEGEWWARTDTIKAAKLALSRYQEEVVDA